MEKKARGGKREGAGRKAATNPKKTVTLYVETKSIYPFGNEEKMKGKLYDFISEYGKPKEPPVIVKDFTKPTNEIKPYQQPQSNYAVNIPTPKEKPLKPSVSAQVLMQQYLEEKRECQDAGMWAELLERIDGDDRLTPKQKELVKNTL